MLPPEGGGAARLRRQASGGITPSHLVHADEGRHPDCYDSMRRDASRPRCIPRGGLNGQPRVVAGSRTTKPAPIKSPIKAAGIVVAVGAQIETGRIVAVPIKAGRIVVAVPATGRG